VSKSVKTWIWICLAIVLTLTATLCEIQVLAAGITIGDTVGSPPSFTESGKLFMHQMQLKANAAVAGCLISLLAAVTCLALWLLKKYDDQINSLLLVVVAVIACPAMSVAFLGCFMAFVAFLS
jgi:hypothetical protein